MRAESPSRTSSYRRLSEARCSWAEPRYAAGGRCAGRPASSASQPGQRARRAAPRAGRRPARLRGRSCRRRRAGAARRRAPPCRSPPARPRPRRPGRRAAAPGRRRGRAAPRTASAHPGAAARQSTAMTAAQGLGLDAARANSASDRAPRSPPARAAAASSASSSGCAGGSSTSTCAERSRRTARRAKLWWSAIGDDAVADASSARSQYRRLAAARAHQELAGAVAARIGQRRAPALDVGDQHDTGRPLPRARPAPPRRGRAARQRHVHRLAGGDARPRGAEPGAGCRLDRLARRPRRRSSRSTSRGASAPFHSLTPRRQTTSRRPPSRSGSACAPCPNATAPQAADASATCSRRCAALAHLLDARELRAGDEQLHARVAQPEAAPASQLARELERHLADRHHGVDAAAGGEVVVGQARPACAASAAANALDRVGGDARARRRRDGRRSAEVAGAGGEAGVQVVGRDRATRCPCRVAADRDQHDRAARSARRAARRRCLSRPRASPRQRPAARGAAPSAPSALDLGAPRRAGSPARPAGARD